MNPADSLPIVENLMLGFADRTGLSEVRRPPRRYLWTDAFAVCNFLELYRRTRADKFRDLTVALIDQVHEMLGRHRPDDDRRGWISGLAEAEGRSHPTAGGLRIGKALPERRPAEARNDHLEWDQDGQYFHYLTKWMHALHLAAKFTGHADFNRLSRELARTAHARFTYQPSGTGPKRMYWKMSIDLSHPLVASMGQNDPLDGLITYYELGAALTVDSSGPDLKTEIEELAALLRNYDWITDDPLGLGGLLIDACRVGKLTVKGIMTAPDLIEEILSASLAGLESFGRQHPFALPADHRLAFRELGLSIGLKAARLLLEILDQSPESFDVSTIVRQLEGILAFAHLARDIDDFWLVPGNQRTDAWMEHRDINEVMLATSLAPEVFLNV